MRFSVVTICVAAVILALVLDADAWWWGRRRRRRSRRITCTTKTSSAQKPYYFGKTNLWCMSGKKGKRGTPGVFVWSLSHSFVYYEGWYFEFGIGRGKQAVYNRQAVASNRCKSSKRRNPAGYSTLSVDCLKRCTRNYKRKYGRYRLLRHNCHHFANRISKILCKSRSCPGWCR